MSNIKESSELLRKRGSKLKRKTFMLCLLACFIAISAFGAQFPLFMSISLDSLPAFLAAMLIGGWQGAVVGACGHLLTAVLSGFPFTLPLHLVVACEMALTCFITGWTIQKKQLPVWLAGIIGFILNAFVAPLIVTVWPSMGWPVFAALFLPLVIGSAVNVTGAVMLAYALKKPYHSVAGALQ